MFDILEYLWRFFIAPQPTVTPPNRMRLASRGAFPLSSPVPAPAPAPGVDSLRHPSECTNISSRPLPRFGPSLPAVPGKCSWVVEHVSKTGEIGADQGAPATRALLKCPAGVADHNIDHATAINILRCMHPRIQFRNAPLPFPDRLALSSTPKTSRLSPNCKRFIFFPRKKQNQVIRDDVMIKAYESLRRDCNLVADRLSLIATSKECPYDLEQAVCTIIWAADHVDVSILCLPLRDVFIFGLRVCDSDSIAAITPIRHSGKQRGS